MIKSFLIHSKIQKKWIEKFKTIEDSFKARANSNDLHANFPFENIEWLIKMEDTCIFI